MIHKSIEKIENLSVRQNEDMAQFEVTEQTAVQDKKKRLHYESIRIEEIFSVGAQVYAISAKTQDQADPSRSLIKRIRRHFETTAPQELKQFE